MHHGVQSAVQEMRYRLVVCMNRRTVQPPLPQCAIAQLAPDVSTAHVQSIEYDVYALSV